MDYITCVGSLMSSTHLHCSLTRGSGMVTGPLKGETVGEAQGLLSLPS